MATNDLNQSKPFEIGLTPLFNWSTIAGVLRIAHFMGLHALQLGPLFVILTGIKTAKPAIIFSCVYFLFVSLLFYNAMMGQPLF